MKAIAVIVLLAVLFAVAQTIIGPLWAASITAGSIVAGFLIRLGTYEIPMPTKHQCPCCHDE